MLATLDPNSWTYYHTGPESPSQPSKALSPLLSSSTGLFLPHKSPALCKLHWALVGRLERFGDFPEVTQWVAPLPSTSSFILSARGVCIIKVLGQVCLFRSVSLSAKKVCMKTRCFWKAFESFAPWSFRDGDHGEEGNTVICPSWCPYLLNVWPWTWHHPN